MFVGKIKTYIVSCIKCDWSESYPVNESFPNLFNSNKSHLPTKCPKCGAKTKRKKSPVDLWMS